MNPIRPRLSPRPAPPDRDRTAADAWNLQHQIGTAVRYWKGGRRGSTYYTSTTTTPAYVIAGQAVVWVEGEARPVPLAHLSPIPAVARVTPGHGQPKSSRREPAKGATHEHHN